jgi:anaerobic magnesium-protoporphyrin IX monomethyl ester cyclase
MRNRFEALRGGVAQESSDVTDTPIPYLLINTPLTDPTTPYHSLSYVIGAAVEAGHKDFSCFDANIEALTFLTQECNVDALIRRSEKLCKAIEAGERLTRADELAYRYALKGAGLTAEAVAKAIATMQGPEQFYDYRHYRQAVLVLTRWLDLLSIDGFPGQFSSNFGLRGLTGSFSSLADLTNPLFIDRLVRPFLIYFDGPFQQVLSRAPWTLVGLSVNFISQLPFAVWMCNRIRRELPDTTICLGGTEITDVVKGLAVKQRLWDLFPSVDVIVVGEGETAFVEILDSIKRKRGLPKGSPGILLADDPVAIVSPSNVRYEDLKRLPIPRYDVWDYKQYWSPEPVLLYSPTRGCYWNRCTFCDYGLNTDKPTSPSRQRPIDIAVKELMDINDFARTIYFSVDTISPAYLGNIARAMIQAKLRFQWSAEVRLERALARGLADELSEAGCLALAFGYESGSKRILNLIDKGVNLDAVPEMLRELRRVGIGAQMMGFIGFPRETLQDAHATFEFLLENRDFWTVAGIGDFVLTPGAIVAKRFREFGIQWVGPKPGDDIVRSLCWIDEDGHRRGIGEARNSSISDFAKSVSRFTFTRPFVGGIDSAHTILYFGKFGVQLIPSAFLDTADTECLVVSTLYSSPFKNVDNFITASDVMAFRQERLDAGAATSFGDVCNWLAEVRARGPSVSEHAGSVLEILPSGELLTVDNQEAAFLGDGRSAYKKLRDMLLQGHGVA